MQERKLKLGATPEYVHTVCSMTGPVLPERPAEHPMAAFVTHATPAHHALDRAPTLGDLQTVCHMTGPAPPWRPSKHPAAASAPRATPAPSRPPHQTRAPLPTADAASRCRSAPLSHLCSISCAAATPCTVARALGVSRPYIVHASYRGTGMACQSASLRCAHLVPRLHFED